MLENLQMAQPGQGGDSDMEQALNELGDMIRKQQQLRDKTFKQGQDSRRDRMRGKQGGDQSMGDLQQDQQGLRDRLKKLQHELAKRGMRAQKGQQQGDQGQQGAGQQGRSGLTARTVSARPTAPWAMPAASSARAMPTARWTRRARRSKRCARARRSSPKRCSRATATRRHGPGDRMGRQQAGANGPIRSAGRCAAANAATSCRKMIPGEIDVQHVRRILEELRRRLADPSRPQIELDYIERLLKDY